MDFIALANFNLLVKSILLVSPCQQESDACTRKPGMWTFGFSKGLPICFRLPIHTLMAKLSCPRLWPSCVSHRWGTNQPFQRGGDTLVVVEEDGTIAYLCWRSLWKYCQSCWVAGNRLEYLPSLSEIFDIESWERETMTASVCRTVHTLNEEQVVLPHRIKRSGRWKLGIRYAPISVWILKIHTMTVLDNIYGHI